MTNIISNRGVDPTVAISAYELRITCLRDSLAELCKRQGIGHEEHQQLLLSLIAGDKQVISDFFKLHFTDERRLSHMVCVQMVKILHHIGTSYSSSASGAPIKYGKIGLAIFKALQEHQSLGMDQLCQMIPGVGKRPHIQRKRVSNALYRLMHYSLITRMGDANHPTWKVKQA